MKNLLTIIFLLIALGATGCDATSKIAAGGKDANSANTSPPADNQAGNQSVNVTIVPTPQSAKSANASKAPVKESLPRKIDADTAESPVYNFNSKNCERLATDDFVYKCKAYGDYILTGGGYDGINNYSVEPKNADAGFVIDLIPLLEGDAKQYLRNEKFVQKLGDKITWLLDDKGKPFALFVHASFYKAAGGAKTFSNPKNKVAEFVFLRGLSVSEEMDHDIQAVDTAYNPDEWARKVAYEVLEKNKR